MTATCGKSDDVGQPGRHDRFVVERISPERWFFSSRENAVRASRYTAGVADDEATVINRTRRQAGDVIAEPNEIAAGTQRNRRSDLTIISVGTPFKPRRRRKTRDANA